MKLSDSNRSEDKRNTYESTVKESKHVEHVRERKEMLDELKRPPSAEEAPKELQLDEAEAKEYESKGMNWLMHIGTGISILAMVGFFFWGYKHGIFESQDALSNFVSGLGMWGPLVFVLIQIVQVVIPIIPGALGCAVGVIVFGPIWGLVYNYIGICIGSMFAFMISRKYGKPMVVRMVGQKIYNKYIGFTKDSKRFERIFAFLIFIPVAPDDALCYIAGLTRMTLKKYALIIWSCKPFSIALYSLGLTLVLDRMWQWISALF